jgi:ABC-type antimicrobial peptide transport system permease subunit
LIVGEGVGLAVAGVVVGAALAAVASSAMAGLLYETRPSDPIVFSSVIATLILVAIVASFVPAHRAMRVDPIVVLREE